jgi:phosphotransacetylase
VGPADQIRQLAAKANLNIDRYPIEDADDPISSAAKAVAIVRSARAEALMKGSLHTDELMSAVVPSATGLRTGRRITHAFVMALPTYPKPLIVTDGAINIGPTLEEKRDICQNAIDLAHSLGRATPKVAILSAVESVTSKIPSTIDAAALCKMADRGQITGRCSTGRSPWTTPSASKRRGPRESRLPSQATPTSWWRRTWRQETSSPSN